MTFLAAHDATSVSAFSKPSTTMRSTASPSASGQVNRHAACEWSGYARLLITTFTGSIGLLPLVAST